MKMNSSKKVYSVVLFLALNVFWLSSIHAQKVSMGKGNVLYICPDSTISAIGSNNGYQLGDGTNIERHLPVKVRDLQSAVAVNAYGSLALLSDSTVWQWSKNNSYSLTKIDIDSVIAITSGDQLNGGKFYGALRADSSLWLWGDRNEIEPNTWGFKDSLEKMDIPKVRKVQGGNDCVIALCEDSTVWTWGFAKVEGNGNLIQYPNYQIWKPQKVNTLAKIVDIAAGGIFATVWALKDDGTVWEWGWLHDHSYPVKMEVSDVASIFVGSSYDSDGFYTLLKDGTLCFYNSILWRPWRVDTIANFNGINCIASFGSMDEITSYMLDENGYLWRWGGNTYGQLGNFTTFPIHSPEILSQPCLTVNCDTITENEDVLILDTLVFAGDPVKLRASDSETGLFWWYPENNIINGQNMQEAIVFITEDTEFAAVLMDEYGCLRKEKFKLHRMCNPEIKVIMDTVTYPGATIVLQADTGTLYSWQPLDGLSNADSSQTVALINDAVAYTVSYMDTLDCLTQEKYIIRIRNCDTIVASYDTLLMDTLITPGSYINLSASNAASFYWSPSVGLICDTCRQNIARVYVNTEYVVNLMDTLHCEWTERFRITNYCDSGTLTNPEVIFDSVTYPAAQLDLLVPVSKIYLWQPETGLSCTECNNPIVTISSPVQYYVTLTDSFNCSSKYSFIMRIRDCDTIVLQEEVVRLDTIINYTTEIQLIASESYNGYSWSSTAGLSCDNCQFPFLIADKSCEYFVETYNLWHCRLLETFKLTMQRIDVFIPNVITPNNDGYNDFFEVTGLTPDSKLKIYNSIGSLVYTSDNYQNEWNGNDKSGNELNEGTYWYNLDIPEADTFQGWVYIKR